jgi:L-iditol 2-dehydrogenase
MPCGKTSVSSMKALLVTGLNAYSVTSLPVPEPRCGEALVDVAVAGLCRTDLKLIEHGHRDLVLPRVPAEEVAGTVCAVGSPADRHWVGRRVYVYPGSSCGQCHACRQGAGNLCASMQIMGFHRDGGFAEYVATPVASLIEIPAALAFESAVFAEPLSCVLNALELGGVHADDCMAVFGAGPAGTLTARAARHLGADVAVVEPDPQRRLRAGGIGQLPASMAADVAMVAVGAAGAYEQALAHLAPRGRLVVFSGLLPGAMPAVDLNRLHYLEQTLVGAYGCSFRHGAQALDWIARGHVRVDDLVSQAVTLDDMEQALERVRTRQGMKILVYPNQQKKESSCRNSR